MLTLRTEKPQNLTRYLPWLSIGHSHTLDTYLIIRLIPNLVTDIF